MYYNRERQVLKEIVILHNIYIISCVDFCANLTECTIRNRLSWYLNEIVTIVSP